MNQGDRVVLKRHPATGAGEVTRIGFCGVLVRFDDELRRDRWCQPEELMTAPENRSKSDVA